MSDSMAERYRAAVERERLAIEGLRAARDRVLRLWAKRCREDPPPDDLERDVVFITLATADEAIARYDAEHQGT